MSRRRLTRARSLPATLRRAAGAQDGSFLVEAMVSALIIVIIGAGVLKSLDRGSRLGGEQKVLAVAGNVAQAEQETIRSLPVSVQSNMRRSSTRAVGGVAYQIDSRADWVNDKTGDAGCTTAGSSADYMKLSTVVTWPQMGTRTPVRLESLITPGVRAFSAGQGSLAVRISDRNGDPVSGLQLALSGGATLSDTTNDSGCVLWGYLDAGSGYALGFSRPPDYVLADGSQVANVPVAVVGGQTSNVALLYDHGGYLTTRFVTRRNDSADLADTKPQLAHVTNSGGGGVSVAFPVTGSTGTSRLLFPFTSAYTIHADSCSAAEVPVPAPTPVPSYPPGLPVAAGRVSPGTTTATADLQLPSLNITVKSLGTLKAGAAIRVTTPCGTVYRRTTTSDGLIDDPGFPYASNLSICVSDGTRMRTLSKPNNNFNGTQLTVALVSTDSSGTCA